MNYTKTDLDREARIVLTDMRKQSPNSKYKLAPTPWHITTDGGNTCLTVQLIDKDNWIRNVNCAI